MKPLNKLTFTSLKHGRQSDKTKYRLDAPISSLNISPIALRTGGRTDKVSYRVASLLIILIKVYAEGKGRLNTAGKLLTLKLLL